MSVLRYNREMESSMKKISVVMAIQNEEDVLEGCLKSIYKIADEIIIVDGQSTDKSVGLIKDFDKAKKVKILSVPNEANFHKMKQLAIGSATGKWIFQIDADERLSSELSEEILAIADNKTESDILGYWVKRMNFFMGRPLTKGGQYPDKTLRFYQNRHGYLPAKDIHEQAIISRKKLDSKSGRLIAPTSSEIIIEPSAQIGELKNNLNHYPYRSFEMYLNKWVRYNKLEAAHLQEKPSTLRYLLIKPLSWFLKTYLRHRGYVDGPEGFIFSLFSALRFIGIWIEWKNLQIKNTH